MAVPIKDLLTNNTIRMYYAFDEAMMKAHREVYRPPRAISIARTLLANADLPPLIRVRACIVLGCSKGPNFLHIAKEGVRITQLALSRCRDRGETESQLVKDAKQVLEEAQKAADGTEEGEGVEVEEDEEEDLGEGEAEVVWEAGKDEAEE